MAHSFRYIILVAILCVQFVMNTAQEDDDDDDEEVFTTFGRSDEEDRGGGLDEESGVLQVIADDMFFDRDYYEEESYLDQSDEDESDEDESELELDNLIVQKLSDDKTMTSYFNFDADWNDSPIFRRKWEDFNTDYILFLNPIYSLGTGHFLILRKLKDELTVTAPEGELDEVELHEDNESESIEPASESDEVEGDADDDGDDDSDDAGEMESGDENWADLFDDTGPLGKGRDGIDPVLKEKFGKFSNQTATDIPDDEEEYIYEAFEINFKESLLGYVSNVNPMELVESGEDENEDDEDDEDDDDSSSSEDDDAKNKDKDKNETRRRRHADGIWTQKKYYTVQHSVLTTIGDDKVLLKLQKVPLTGRPKQRVCRMPKKLRRHQCLKPMARRFAKRYRH